MTGCEIPKSLLPSSVTIYELVHCAKKLISAVSKGAYFLSVCRELECLDNKSALLMLPFIISEVLYAYHPMHTVRTYLGASPQNTVELTSE